MLFKFTLQGFLIYAAMATYLSAFTFCVLKFRRVGQIFYFIGFLIAATAFIYRWTYVGHIPFQGMFDIFLSLGLLIYPLSVFCRRFLNVSGDAADALIGFVLLFPAGFIFSSEPQMLPPALQSPLFIPHVFVYLLGYVIMFKAGVQAVYQLTKKDEQYEYATYKMVCFGFPLLTLGLMLGSWWGKLAWCDYWNWDPKELWSLATWLIFAEYLHLRYMSGERHPGVKSLLVILGVVAIFITLFWVNLSKLFPSLHNYAS